MKQEMSISKANDLDKIIHFIHDCWFDLSEIRFDSKKGRLTIPYKKEICADRPSGWRKFFRRVATRIETWNLVVDHVIRYNVVDTEKIGSYDFDRIFYDPKTRTVKITTGIPLGFTVVVTDFSMCVEKS